MIVFRPAIISRVLENFCIALDESGHHFSSFLFLLHYKIAIISGVFPIQSFILQIVIIIISFNLHSSLI